MTIALLIWGCVAAPAQARDLAILQDKSAKITIADDFSCKADLTLSLKATNAKFFEDHLQTIGGLYNAALRQLLAECQSLKRITLRGEVGDVLIQTASSAAADGWQLRLDQSELYQRAVSLPDKVKGYDDLGALEQLFIPFRKVPRIAETQGYLAYAQQAQAVVNALVSQGFSPFDAFANDLIAAPSSRNTAFDTALDAFRIYRPDLVAMLEARYAKLKETRRREEWAGVLKEALSDGMTLQAALTRIDTQMDRRPVDGAMLADIDAELAAFTAARLEAHEDTHAGAYLTELAAHGHLLDDLRKLQPDDRLTLTAAVLEEAVSWYGDYVPIMLEDYLERARATIDQTGTRYSDVEEILATGFALAGEFEDSGFTDAAVQLETATVTRIDTLLATGLDRYRAELAVLDMTRETSAILREELTTFGELTQDFPGFAAYADATEQAILDGRRRACQTQAGTLRAGVGADFAVLDGDRLLGLTELACALYDNNHILTAASVGARGKTAALTIDRDAGLGPREVTLVAIGRDNGANGFADTAQGNSVEWQAELSGLLIPPPHGRPDARGLTECDLLAGDPSDPAQPGRGVDLLAQPVDFDVERALDACIAAVEHDPGATRQVFQLGRVLEFLGDAETAQEYLSIAADRDYAPAQHQQAMLTLTYGEGDDAFFDAIDLFKAAAQRGYEPARRELDELMPPGTELYREIPEPTDSEIMKTVRTRICEGAMGMSVCVIRTGVERKSCMQISADAFSCELVLRNKCDVNMGNDPVMRLFAGLTASSCPPRTDPMFLRFTKSANGWSYKNEF